VDHPDHDFLFAQRVEGAHIARLPFLEVCRMPPTEVFCSQDEAG
jgi:hypothetical protein